MYLRNLNLPQNQQSPVEWITDTKSIWGADSLSTFLDSLNVPEDAPIAVQSALTYLKNWDYDFGGQSIGATIYHEWTITGGETLEEEFSRAVEQLTDRLGGDQSQWLWERVHTDTSWFTFQDPYDKENTKPLISPIIGHESTMIWGGTRAINAPNTWESWTWIEPSSPLFIRRRVLNLRQFLGRSIAGKHGSSIFRLPDSYMSISFLVPNDIK